MKRRKQSRRWRGKKYAPVMIGMLVLLMNLADLKISNLISGSIICQAAERQSENTETENNSGGTEKEKITQTEASTVSDILEELDLSRVQRMLQPDARRRKLFHEGHAGWSDKRRKGII